MVDLKISDLPWATTLNSTDQFEINQGGVSKSANTALISTYIGNPWTYLTGNVFLTPLGGNVAIGIEGSKSNLRVNGNVFSSIGYETTGNLVVADSTITSAGKVGIATLAPVANLHVTGNVFATTVEVASGGTYKQGTITLFDSSANLSNARWNSGTSASYLTYLRGDGTWATPSGGGVSAPWNEDNLLNVTLVNTAANVSIGPTVTGIKSKLLVEGNVHTTSNIFAAGNAWFAIGSGRVGITTTAPAANLHVNGNVFATSIEVASAGTLKQGTVTLFDSSANLSNARINSGTSASIDTYLRGDMTWRSIVGKQAIWIPALAMTSRTTNGPSTGLVEMTTNKNMFVTHDFDATTQEFSQFSWCMPSSWNEGTVTFLPVWSHSSTSTNFGVVWQLAGVAISDDDAGDVAFGTAQTSTDTGGTTNDIYKGPESSAITISGSPAAGDFVMFQIARVPANGSDTMPIDARLHGVVLFITTNDTADS